MRRILAAAAVLLAVAGYVIASGATAASGSDPTYKVELDNAFGLITGEQFKVAGVPAGTISSVDLDQKTLHALVTVQVTQSGFGDFHQDATCESRPQSLIGEYFLNCDPGNSGPVLAPGATIPVTHTTSTIPADLLQDIMRMPYRERLTLLINELGAGVAGNAQNLQAALQRAVPALTETDNLLNVLANDSHTLQDLSATANSLVTALANNSRSVQNFVVQSNNIATETATQQTALKGTFHDLPGFLEQLRPALQKLGLAADANTPALTNLNASAGQIDRLLTDLPPFSHSALPALRSLGRASVTGKAAVIAARPAIGHLKQFAGPPNCSGQVFNCTPELAQNLSIVLHDLDDRSRAVEPDPRSPGGKGYTGFESIIQYVFNQALAIDYFSPFGHTLALDLIISPTCTPYATPGTVAANLKTFGAAYRQCYTWLGPNQPGVNTTDPSNPSACVPDPGGEPPYAPAGAHPTAGIPCKSSATARRTTLVSATRRAATASVNSVGTGGGGGPGASAGVGGRGGSGGGGPQAPALNLQQTISGLLGVLGAGSGSGSSATSTSTGSQPTTGTATVREPATTSSGGSQQPLGQAQQLLNYLLSP